LGQNDGDLKGVGGWLLVLCLLLTVLDPFVALSYLFAQTQEAAGISDLQVEVFRFFVVQGALAIGLAVFSMYAGLSLWKIAPKAIRTAQYYLMTEAAFSFLPFFLPALLGVSDDFRSDVVVFDLLNAVAATAYASIWYAYLSRSRRVTNTYREEPEETTA
jgi:hypothetical protein